LLVVVEEVKQMLVWQVVLEEEQVDIELLQGLQAVEQVQNLPSRYLVALTTQ
jgi:hypothetical protein